LTAAALLASLAGGCLPGSDEAEGPLIEVPAIEVKKPPESVPPSLGVIELRAYQVLVSRDERRILVRALIENQSAHDLPSPFRLDVRLHRGGQVVGTCRGDEGLPAARVALCEVWIDPKDPALEGAILEAELARGVPGFAAWDKVAADDRREVVLRTLTEETGTLRITEWSLQPVMLPRGGEVTFRFAVEGAHLVWLMSEEKTPRLLAGNPADGLLEGRGRVNVMVTGPVTLIARNSLGVYVYRAAPVFVSGTSGGELWATAQVPTAAGQAVAKILEPGIYDIYEQDQLLLESILAFQRGLPAPAGAP
jgi:hypothetical protein